MNPLQILTPTNIEGLTESQDGFFKSGSSNDYFLLGGGGHTHVSNFAPSVAGGYVPYTGATANLNMGTYLGTFNGITIGTDVSGYKGFDSSSPFAFLNNGSAQKIYTGGLLVSNQFQDENSVPENGIYSKGQIHTASGLKYTRAIDVSGLDFNNLREAGFYSGTDLTHAPEDSLGWFHITIQRYSFNNEWVHQVATTLGSGNLPNKTYSRVCQGGNNWTLWSTMWGSLNDGAGSGLDADLLDGQHGNYYATAAHNHTLLSGWGNTSSVATVPTDYYAKFEVKGMKLNSVMDISDGGIYSTVLGLKGWHDSSGGLTYELAFDYAGRILYRTGNTTSWDTWNIFATQSWVNTQITNTGHSHSNKTFLDTLTENYFVKNVIPNTDANLIEDTSFNHGTMNMPFFFPSDQSGTVLHKQYNASYSTQLAMSYYGGMAYRHKQFGSLSPWYKVYTSLDFNIANYYTKNESLNLFVGLTGVQTIYNTKTFDESPIVPAGTLAGHAVNVQQLNDVQIGGRNYYKKNTPIYPMSGTTNIVKTETGFSADGVVANNAEVRLGGVITENGEWTVSFEHKIDSPGYAISLDICDQGTVVLPPNTDVNWKKVSHTVNIPNYGDGSIYNFVDIGGLTGQTHYFRNFKVEKGNKATDWTPAPEDQVSDWNQTNVTAFDFIKNKPTSLPPTAHTHVISDVTDLQTVLDNKITHGGLAKVIDFTAGNIALAPYIYTGSEFIYLATQAWVGYNYYTKTQLQASGQALVHWDNITGEPSTFTPSSHGHVISDVTGLQSELDNRVTIHTPQTIIAEKTFTEIVRGNQGFQNTYFITGRNRIWSFGNADNYGLSYQQEAFVVGGVSYGEGINFHFGDYTDFKQHFSMDGTIHSKIHGNSAQWNQAYNWGDHAGLYIPTTHPANSITTVDITNWNHFLSYTDDRIITPNEIEVRKLRYGFTSWNNNDTPPYADFLHFGGYPDASGGNQNLLLINKGSFGIRQYQATSQSTTPYETFVDYWHTGNFDPTNHIYSNGTGLELNGNTFSIKPEVMSDIASGVEAYNWGDHSSVGYLTWFNETDPTVPAWVKSITQGNIAEWQGKVNRHGDTMSGGLSINPGTTQHTHEFKTDGVGGRNDIYLRSDIGTTQMRMTVQDDGIYTLAVGPSISMSNGPGFDYLQLPAWNSQFRMGFFATQLPGYMSAISGSGFFGGDVYTQGQSISDGGFVHNQYTDPDALLTSDGGVVHTGVDIVNNGGELRIQPFEITSSGNAINCAIFKHKLVYIRVRNGNKIILNDVQQGQRFIFFNVDGSSDTEVEIDSNIVGVLSPYTKISLYFTSAGEHIFYDKGEIHIGGF